MTGSSESALNEAQSEWARNHQLQAASKGKGVCLKILPAIKPAAVEAVAENSKGACYVTSWVEDEDDDDDDDS